jgi:hypothetical protein
MMNHLTGTVQKAHDSLPDPTLQAFSVQRVSDIKSGINPNTENMTVALFAQMQSLIILSPFADAVAVRCPLRFCSVNHSAAKVMVLRTLSSVDTGQYGTQLDVPLCIMEHLHWCSLLVHTV